MSLNIHAEKIWHLRDTGELEACALNMQTFPLPTCNHVEINICRDRFVIKRVVSSDKPHLRAIHRAIHRQIKCLTALNSTACMLWCTNLVRIWRWLQFSRSHCNFVDIVQNTSQHHRVAHPSVVGHERCLRITMAYLWYGGPFRLPINQLLKQSIRA